MSKHQWYSLALVILLLVACINPTAAYKDRTDVGFDPAVGIYTNTPHALAFKDNIHINHIRSSHDTITIIRTGNIITVTSGNNPRALFVDTQSIDFSTFTRPSTQPETHAHKPVTVAPIVVIGVVTSITDGEVTAIILSSTAIVGAISMKHPELMHSLWGAYTALAAMFNAAVLFISSDASTQTDTTYGVTLEMSKAGTQQCTDATHRFDYPTDKEKGLPVKDNDKEVNNFHTMPTTGNAYSSAQLFNNQVDKDNGCPKQIRYFGKDGKIDKDIDFSHGAGLDTCEESTVFPHIHTWVDGARSETHIRIGIDTIVNNWKCKKYNFNKGTWCP